MERRSGNGRGEALAVLDVTKWFADTSGGVKTYLAAKQAYVAARAHLRQVMVVPARRDRLEDAPGVRTYGVRGPPVPTQGYRLLLDAPALRRIVEHERPDVIEVGSPFVVPWIAAWAARPRRTPLVGFYHTSVPRAFGFLGSGRPPLTAAAEAVGRVYLRRLLDLFRVVVVSSHFAAGDLREVGFGRVERIPLGVDLERFHPRRRLQAAWTRRALGIPAGAPLCVFVGRLAPDKRVEVMLDAWPEVERSTGAALAIVGDGPSAGSLRAAARGRNVCWIPYLRDRGAVANLLAAADLYLAPGVVETFGLAALEALASGTPVLSVNRGAVPELVTRSGAGLLYQVDRPWDLAEQAVALLRGDPAPLRSAARAYAEREHDWIRVFDRLFALYREVRDE